MDGVGISIIGRPRPIPGHDTPNPANNTYTLNYEEPDSRRWSVPTREASARPCVFKQEKRPASLAAVSGA